MLTDPTGDLLTGSPLEAPRSDPTDLIRCVAYSSRISVESLNSESRMQSPHRTNELTQKAPDDSAVRVEPRRGCHPPGTHLMTGAGPCLSGLPDPPATSRPADPASWYVWPVKTWVSSVSTICSSRRSLAWLATRK